MPGRTAVGARLRCASRDRAEEALSERKGCACHPSRCPLRCCTAEPACCLLAARTAFDVCDGSLLSVLSVGRIFFAPYQRRGLRTARPPSPSEPSRPLLRDDPDDIRQIAAAFAAAFLNRQEPKPGGFF